MNLTKMLCCRSLIKENPYTVEQQVLKESERWKVVTSDTTDDLAGFAERMVMNEIMKSNNTREAQYNAR